jgi:hypothetical protein
MALISARKYAEHRGISHTAVQKAIRQGRIHPTSDGRIDVEQADRDWGRNTTPAITPRRTTQVHRAPDPSGGTTYAQSRAVRELYLARLAKIEFEEKSGKLVSRDEVTVAAFTKARTVRDNLLNIPDRVAAMLAAETSAARAHQILTEEIRKALLELSGDNSGGDL